MTIQDIKNRFGIIGTSLQLDHSINIAFQVAPTDLSVLITGESGTGKEIFPQIIHFLSSRKHGPNIAVNCGAIPEGTIDSELFGHEKGAFTGAHEARKGYFEVVNGGTIFLDEVAELPLTTQVRLLRVLETGEFIRVGSSKVQKTDVRVVAASNVNIPEAIERGRFREDLYYRLNTVPIHVPPLRDRKEDVFLLFRKFAADFADKYKMPVIHLQPEAQRLLVDYRWPGNVRQLKNVTEQLSILEQKKEITADVLMKYLPQENGKTLPMVLRDEVKSGGDFSERELLYKVLFDMKKDLTEMKKVVATLMGNGPVRVQEQDAFEHELYRADEPQIIETQPGVTLSTKPYKIEAHEEVEDESLSLSDKEKEMIRKAIERHKGKRKEAAKELGISERTLYRKINEYQIKG
ncbi:MAG: sigma-54-dependent Fis family transcriptional regulator [Bacteroidetes bacterium]|jgi:transcriptional regulator with PAS, ATPase and Fis domain|nr:sigma-54-dependent Fis family transcriptional regulator [Bacteroidota bacterium]